MTFRYLPRFERELKFLAKKYPSIGADIQNILDSLHNDPYMGKSLGQNCFKIRMPISSKNKGKSGGARVLTCVKIERDTIYFMSIFDKSEKSTISDDEISELLKQIP